MTTPGYTPPNPYCPLRCGLANCPHMSLCFTCFVEAVPVAARETSGIKLIAPDATCRACGTAQRAA